MTRLILNMAIAVAALAATHLLFAAAVLQPPFDFREEGTDTQ